MKKLLVYVFAASLLVACGPSAEEKAAAEKMRQDSIQSVMDKMAADSLAAVQAAAEKARIDSLAAVATADSLAKAEAAAKKATASKPKPKSNGQKPNPPGQAKPGEEPKVDQKKPGAR